MESYSQLQIYDVFWYIIKTRYNQITVISMPLFYEHLLPISLSKYTVCYTDKMSSPITNIKGASPTCFGTSVSSSGRTKCNHWKGGISEVLPAAANLFLMLIKYKR
jgi:hypothetical protein